MLSVERSTAARKRVYVARVISMQIGGQLCGLMMFVTAASTRCVLSPGRTPKRVAADAACDVDRTVRHSLHTRNPSLHCRAAHSCGGYNYDSTRVRLPLDCNSTALQPVVEWS